MADPSGVARSAGFDLLRIGSIRRLVSWRGFPYAFQAALLVAFVALGVAGWGLKAPPGVDEKLFAKSSLVTLLVWGIWWPSMVWLAVLLGRAWCAVCPLELVANVAERLGRAAGASQRSLPRWLAAGGGILLLYLLLQLLVAGAHIHRVPAYTAHLLLGLLVAAAVVGLAFRDRAFCRGVCPVGLLLGTYGRGAVLAVRPGPAEACRACGEQSCRRASRRALLDARSCPSLLDPARLASNRDCLLCGQCVKSCGPTNVRLLLRRPFPSDDVREAEASWPVTLFVIVASGFVTWELLAERPSAERAFLALPTLLARRLGLPRLEGLVSGTWAFVVVPLAAWGAGGALFALSGARGGIGACWRRLALSVAVVVSAGHMVKALAKAVAWAPFLPLVLRAPGGTAAASALAAGAQPAPLPLVPLRGVAIAGCVLLAGAAVLAVREARMRRVPGADGGRALPAIALALTYVAVLAGWGLP